MEYHQSLLDVEGNYSFLQGILSEWDTKLHALVSRCPIPMVVGCSNGVDDVPGLTGLEFAK
jgi:hypothetical protein